MTIPKLNIHPPLINTPCPAVTTLNDLLALWNCPSTGAITTRTSLLSGFPHDDTKNLYVFYDSSSHTVSSSTNPPPSSTTPAQNATLNSLGYSPLPLQTYLDFIRTIAMSHPPPSPPNKCRSSSSSSSSSSNKTIIISVTGSAKDVAKSYLHIARLQSQLLLSSSPSTSSSSSSSSPTEEEQKNKLATTNLAMEINLSCPNIPHRPPPAYSRDALIHYLDSLAGAIKAAKAEGLPRIPVGLKTPPYTYETQFLGLMEALEASAARKEKEKEEDEEEKELECPISFITATNTLGSCLAFTEGDGDDSGLEGALPTELGTGGLAGAPLHPLALGNVQTLRKMLDQSEETLGHRMQIIGVGGVLDAQGYRRMRKAGADMVGLASGLLLKGVEVFGEIEKGLGEDGW